jgi:hypothetical protein
MEKRLCRMPANLHQSTAKRVSGAPFTQEAMRAPPSTGIFRRSAMKAFAWFAAVALTAVIGSWTASAEPVGDLAGFWSGNGSVTLASGNTERVKCQVFYKTAESNTLLKQTMRCASADYTINATADLQVKGGQVTGSWEEKTYAAKGDVTGRLTGESLALMIRGANFTAAMNVALSACKQSINITPKGLDVTKVIIGLAKC